MNLHLKRKMDSEWQHECSSIKSRDAKLLEKGDFSDCSFEVGDMPKTFHAHKVILAKSSTVFATMLFGSLAEPTGIPIKIPDIQPEIFAMMLKYLYTDEIELKSYQDAVDLIYVAEKYMLNFLLKKCNDYFIKNVSPLNALKLYELGQFYEDQELLQAALKVIRENTRSVLSSPYFRNIDLSLMTVIIEQETLQTTEIELFQFLESLAKIQGVIETTEQEPCNQDGLAEESKKHLPASEKKELLKKFQNAAKKIKYLSITAHDFTNGPADSKLLTPEDAFAILKCLVNSENIGTRYPMGFQQTKRQLTFPLLSFDIFMNGSNRGRLVIELRSDVAFQTIAFIQQYFAQTEDYTFFNQNHCENCVNIELNNIETMSFTKSNTLSGDEEGNVIIKSNKLIIKLNKFGYTHQNGVVVGKVISGLNILRTNFNLNGRCYPMTLKLAESF